MKGKIDWEGVIVIAFLVLCVVMFLAWGIENWVVFLQGGQP